MDDLVRAAPSPIHGTGVHARRPIGAGTRIGTYEGRACDVDGDHVLWIESEDGAWEGIDGTGVLRFLNHSRSPNAAFEGPELHAITDIATGDEILIDYGEDWADIP